MTDAVRAAPPIAEKVPPRLPSAKEKMVNRGAKELIFAVVGHIGSGTSEVASQLAELVEEIGGFEPTIVKARDTIEAWALKTGKEVPNAPRLIETTRQLQDLGDEMRKTSPDFTSVGEAIAKRIRSIRGEKQKADPDDPSAVIPDGTARAYIVDAIRHPAEVEVLRHIYQDAFVLIGVVCDEQARIKRIMAKYDNAGEGAAKTLMDCDAKRGPKYGQRVSDAFHMADFFVDNSQPRTGPDDLGNPEWTVHEDLTRLIKIVSHTELSRPTVAETAMHQAYSASMRSACLSRQVGAALVDRSGNIIATGTNEAPKAGGGVYGEGFDRDVQDHRCAYSNKFCSNTRQQINISQKLVALIPELQNLPESRRTEIAREIRSSDVGDLLEFSRAVHAEMDALLSAGRVGKSTVGTRLFVTTFPCHYCARHIVSSGVDEVHFIEPYPKSKALELHKDSIQATIAKWRAPSSSILKAEVEEADSLPHSRVLFRPFVGVAPKMYRRAFLKDRELKAKETGKMEIGVPAWGDQWHLRAAGYAELEASLIEEEGAK